MGEISIDCLCRTKRFGNKKMTSIKSHPSFAASTQAQPEAPISNLKQVSRRRESEVLKQFLQPDFSAEKCKYC